MLLGGRYKLLSTPLSTGSFGSVFVADDERMPRRVAVKILHPQHAESPTVRARFRRELEAACRVSHENVVAVFDIGEDPNLGLYYVMELVRGTALKDYLNGEPLPWTFVHRVATQLTRALHAIHAAGIVHRDLKPQNIMLVERSSLDELVKVLDFGIASLKSPEDDKRDVELTGARMVLGTPPYMSPEQTYMRADRERLGVDIDARSDIYSLGVILYEMAAGRRPFSGDAHDIVVAHRLTKPMPLDRMVGVNVPREFADLVMRCLAKDPKERPQSAKDLLASLKDCELKPVRAWSEALAAASPSSDPHDQPTLGEVLALPVEALPSDTQPRLERPDGAAIEMGPRLTPARSLWAWAPLAVLLVGAISALVAFVAADPSDAASNTRVAAVGEPVGRERATAPTEAAADMLPTDAGPTSASALEAADASDQGGAREPAATAPAPTEAAATHGAPSPDAAALERATPVAALAPGVGDRADAADPHVPGAPPADAAAATAQTVALTVTTQPPGAEVVVDGKVEGITPVNLTFGTKDKRQLELVLKKERYEDRPIVLPVGPELDGRHLVVNETLVRKKATGVRDPFKDL